MKIAYILPHLKLYGGVRRALELCNRLLIRGHSIYFYTPTGWPCDWFDNKVPVRKLENASKDKFDLVVFTLESQYEEPKRFNTKAILYYILHYGPLYKYPEICKASYQEPYYQIANSSWTASHIERETGKRPPVVHGGINFDMFHPVDVSKIYDVLSYGDEKRAWKGRDDVERLGRFHPDWIIDFLSDIDPPQNEIAAIYCRSRVFFSASHFEGWNWLGLEAMACGVPLVITDDGGSADYAKHGENCLVVPPRDLGAASKAIQRLLDESHPVLRDKLRTAGLKTAWRFTWEKSVKEFEKHCEQAYNLCD